MLLIRCPWCGERDETEYRYGGESHVLRPSGATVSEEEWASYLFDRANTRGIHLERWLHAFGCRQWFNAARDTQTNAVLITYPMGEDPPAFLSYPSAAE
jgi:sarcosine oxidase subunit delta